MIDNKDLIESYGKFIGVTLEDRMLPIIESGINSVKLIEIPETVKLKRLDIILYKSIEDKIALKRIIKKRGQTLYVCGDNEKELEKIKRGDVLAICIGIINNETNEYIDVNSYKFKKYSFFRVLFRIFRKRISR